MFQVKLTDKGQPSEFALITYPAIQSKLVTSKMSKICPVTPTNQDLEIKSWLEKHHRVVPPSELNADEVHIFANRAIGIFGDDKSDTVYYEVTFNLGPVDYKNWVGFDRTGDKFSVCTFYEIPLNPAYRLGSASGKMDDRLTMSFGEFPKGRLDFYIKENWVWLQYDVTSFGRQYVGEIKLVPPPC